MKLADYLSRIGYAGPARPDLDCLNAIHRQHLLSIPYENLDVQLERPVDLDIERIFEKIVHRQRGGWCYEMNGLLGWALGEIGFDVTRMTGAVWRREQGDEALGNHLVLGVELDGPHVADVGLGNGLLESIPLRQDRFTQDAREFRLESLGEGYWRFHNFATAVPPDFDFMFAPADEALLAKKCEELQSDPNSIFRQNFICQRLRPDGAHLLVGRALVSMTDEGATKTLLNSASEFEETLSLLFDLNDAEASDLWPAVLARHEVIFGNADSEPEAVEP